MAVNDRGLMYNTVTTDLRGNVVQPEVVDFFTNIEPDFLDSALIDMSLPSIESIRLPSVFEGRVDLLSLKYFGTYHLGWLIAYHNDFEDMVESFSVGTVVRIPDVSEYYKVFNRFSREG